MTMQVYKAQPYIVGELVIFGRDDAHYGRCCIILHFIEQRWGLANTRMYIVLSSFGEKKKIHELELRNLVMHHDVAL